MNIFFKYYLISLVTLITFGVQQRLQAQDFLLHENASDSLYSTILNDSIGLSIAEVFLNISHTKLEVEVALNNLDNDLDLNKVENENNSLINSINKDLANYSFDEESLSIENNRLLGSDAIYWGHYLKTINNKIDEIYERITYYNKTHKAFIVKLKDFDIVDDYIINEADSNFLDLKARNTRIRIEQIIAVLDNKMIKSVKILDDLITTKIQLTTLAHKISNKKNERRTSFSDITQKSLFSINYLDKKNWDLSKSTRMIKNEFSGLKIFVNNHKKLVIFNLVFTLLFIIFLSYLKKNHTSNITYEATQIKLYFMKLLSKPISSGFVVGSIVFMSFYPSPPLIYFDIIRTILVVPFFILLSALITKKYKFYIYTLTVVIIARFIYIFFPEGTIYTRLLLIIIAISEFLGGLFILVYIKSNTFFKTKFFNSVILAIAIVALLMMLVGFISNIVGNVMFSELLLDSVIRTFVSILSMVLLLIIVNGLIILFIESKKADSINSIRKNRARLIHGSSTITTILISILLVYYIVNDMGYSQLVFDNLVKWFTHSITIVSFTFSIAIVFTFFFIIWISIVIARLINSILENDVLERMNIEPGLPNTILVIVKYGIITLGFFIAIKYAGIPFNQLTIIIGAFGIGIGFGLQNIFNNLVSGLILLFERPIKIADIIEVGTLIGEVKSIGIRSSKVRTFDGAEIIVPNGNLISNEVINWTLSERTRRSEVIVGISYNSDPNTARDILFDVLSNNKHIVSDPEPQVMFTKLGDSSLDFRLLYWSNHNWVEVRSEVIFEVFYALKKAGIKIPYPQQDLHLSSINEDVEIKTKHEAREK